LLEFKAEYFARLF